MLFDVFGKTSVSGQRSERAALLRAARARPEHERARPWLHEVFTPAGPERGGGREREGVGGGESTLLHKDKDLGTCRHFYKADPERERGGGGGEGPGTGRGGEGWGREAD